MSGAERRGADAGAVPSVPAVAIGPAVGLGLIAAALLVLVADRTLGLTAIAVSPGSGVAATRLGPVTLLADVVAAVVVAAVLAIGDAVARPRRAGLRAVALLIAALVALQVGSAAAESITGRPVPLDLHLGRALLLTGSLLAARTVLASLVEHRRATGALRASTAQAEALGEAGRAALARLREDVSVRVREVLRDALDALAVRDLQGDVTLTAPDAGGRLRNIAEDVLRPLSHRLAVAPAVGLSAPTSVAEPRWRDTFTAVARRPVVPARTLATIAALLTFLRTLVTDQAVVGRLQADAVGADPAGVTASVDAPALLASLTEIALVLVLTWWGTGRIAALLERRRGRLTPSTAWGVTHLALGFVAALTLIAPVLAGALVGQSPSPGGRSALLASFVPLLVVTLGSSMIAAVADERSALRAALVAQSRATARLAARTQAVLAHEQQRLARTLHADVQAAVNAASLRLDRAARDGALTPAVVEDVASRIAEAVERFLRGSASEASLTERIEEVRSLWAGVCGITLDVGSDVQMRIAGDVVTRDLLVDLVAEACANAAVHGAARRVVVAITIAGDGDEVLLEVTDDGAGSRTPARLAAGGPQDHRGPVGPGLGSAVLRASCTRFTLDVGDEGSTLVASVPLA